MENDKWKKGISTALSCVQDVFEFYIGHNIIRLCIVIKDTEIHVA